jgi:methionyl-tRNA formyltransferase
MRVLVLTSTKHSLPVLSTLLGQGLLSGLMVPEREEEEVNMVRTWSRAQRIQPVSCKCENVSSVLLHTISATACDIVIVFGFPWKIPRSLLDVPPHGFFNVHFSLLPAYRGPMPVFWQLRKGELQTGVTVHRMDAGFDTGAIAGASKQPSIPGETEGLCSARLGLVAVNLVMNTIASIEDKSLLLTPQTDTGISYYERPDDEALTINWELHDSAEIQQIVNACNPKFHGALTSLNGTPLRILEVAPADAPDYPGVAAGTVVHSDINHGVFVICKDRKTVRILVVHIPEGIISGGKLAALGIGPGARFGGISK